jgi:hypothetical protein
MAINLDALLIDVLVNVIVVSPAFWLAGRVIVGTRKARFLDAVGIVVTGLVIGGVFQYYVRGVVALLIRLVLWLGLVRHFFDATWGQAILTAGVAVLINVVASVVFSVVLGLAYVVF